MASESAPAVSHRLSSQTDESASEAVIRAVAAAAGDDPTEMPPLYTVVDPDALDALWPTSTDSDRTPTTVEFAFHGYLVRLTGEGDLSVFERDSADSRT